VSPGQRQVRDRLAAIRDHLDLVVRYLDDDPVAKEQFRRMVQGARDAGVPLPIAGAAAVGATLDHLRVIEALGGGRIDLKQLAP
jgi:hypothetical protein